MPPDSSDHLTQQQVREIVRQTVHETLTSMGLDVTDPQQVIEAQADFAYVRSARKGSEEISKWAKRGIVGAAVSAFVYMLSHGFVDGIKLIGNIR